MLLTYMLVLPLNSFSMANLNNTTEMTEIQKNWDKTERYVKQVIAVLQMLDGIILSRHYFF
jgi:hypothetical protein